MDTSDSDLCGSSKIIIVDSEGIAHHSLDLITSFVNVKDLRPLPGDLIEFKRDLYSHWGLYVGDGKVIHVRGGIADSEVSSTGKAHVQMDSMEFVAGLSKVRINNQEAQAELRGVSPLPLERLMESAKGLVGSQVPYDLLRQNCEHYVTEWRYGKSWSDQVESGMKQLGALAHDARQTDMPKMMDALQNLLGTYRSRPT